MTVVYALEDAPKSYTKSLFLAGPSPRKEGDPDWRADALQILRDLEYDGAVFVPLPRDGNWAKNYDGQVEWETKHLHMADLIVFWVPRDMKTLPALTTNIEYGIWFDTGKAILGYPPEAVHMRYLDWHGQREGVPVLDTLEAALTEALTRLDWGALRTDGEREVPLHIWRTPSFQSWYKAQIGAGNRLDGAKVVWTFRVGPKRKVFFWALHVDVWIAEEDRHKTNEVLISRPDIGAVVAYCANPQPYFDHPLQGLGSTRVLLVREFRSPAVTSDGFVKEIPSGSAWTDTEPAVMAAEELHEETGLAVHPSRLRPVGVRQVGATLSIHRAFVYAVELTPEEFGWVEAHLGQQQGVVEDTERTYLSVGTVSNMLADPDVDWSNMGMVLTALLAGTCRVEF